MKKQTEKQGVIAAELFSYLLGGLFSAAFFVGLGYLAYGLNYYLTH